MSWRVQETETKVTVTCDGCGASVHTSESLACAGVDVDSPLNGWVAVTVHRLPDALAFHWDLAGALHAMGELHFCARCAGARVPLL